MGQQDGKRDRVGINVSLTPELARFVEAKVDAGNYASASEVVREGLRLLLDHDHLREARLQQLREGVRVGRDQARRGEVVDADTAFQEIERELDDQERKHGKSRARSS